MLPTSLAWKLGLGTGLGTNRTDVLIDCYSMLSVIGIKDRLTCFCLVLLGN
jgi:hypothetical protein